MRLQTLQFVVLTVVLGVSVISLNKRIVELTDAAAEKVPDISRATRAFVGVYAEDGHASGVAIMYKGELHVLTAAHVVTNMHCSCGAFEGLLDGVVECEVVKQCDDIDIALIKPLGDLPGVQPACVLPCIANLERGEDAWCVSEPCELRCSLERTIVNDTCPLVVNAAAAWFGSSGGGMYVNRGGKLYLAGIIVSLVSPAERNPRTPVCCVSHHSIQEFLSCDTSCVR